MSVTEMRNKIAPTRGLKGEVTIPGDKSISHRSIMLGSIALGTTEITHFLEGADCLSTIDCFRKMGIEIEVESDILPLSWYTERIARPDCSGELLLMWETAELQRA